MNTGITSKEAIMQVCRVIVAEKGLSALNMRSVADGCQIALGTLYNYYSNKDDLLLATIESVWKDIFHMHQQSRTAVSFPEYVIHIFECVREGAKEYPDFFTAHSVSIANSEKGRAKSTMEHCFKHIKLNMLEVLQHDKSIGKNVFSSDLTETDFVDFVFDNILLLLVQGKTGCATLVEMIRRVIYE